MIFCSVGPEKFLIFTFSRFSMLVYKLRYWKDNSRFEYGTCWFKIAYNERMCTSLTDLDISICINLEFNIDFNILMSTTIIYIPWTKGKRLSIGKNFLPLVFHCIEKTIWVITQA